MAELLVLLQWSGHRMILLRFNTTDCFITFCISQTSHTQENSYCRSAACAEIYISEELFWTLNYTYWKANGNQPILPNLSSNKIHWNINYIKSHKPVKSKISHLEMWLDSDPKSAPVCCSGIICSLFQTRNRIQQDYQKHWPFFARVLLGSYFSISCWTCSCFIGG